MSLSLGGAFCAVYLSLSTVVTGARSFLLVGSVPGSVVNSIPGLHPADVSSTPPTPSMTTQNVSGRCEVSPGGKIASAENTSLRGR